MGRSVALRLSCRRRSWCGARASPRRPPSTRPPPPPLRCSTASCCCRQGRSLCQRDCPAVHTAHRPAAVWHTCKHPTHTSPHEPQRGATVYLGPNGASHGGQPAGGRAGKTTTNTHSLATGDWGWDAIRCQLERPCSMRGPRAPHPLTPCSRRPGPRLPCGYLPPAAQARGCRGPGRLPGGCHNQGSRRPADRGSLCSRLCRLPAAGRQQAHGRRTGRSHAGAALTGDGQRGVGAGPRQARWLQPLCVPAHAAVELR